jgi:ankyrin repeat protein
MSSLGKPGSKEGLDDTHGQSKPRDDATEDVETGSWLSKMASATVKYRRVLGEDPAPYAPPKATGVATRSDGIDEKASSIRTDILTRDLSWWTSDPRIVALHGEANDTLGTGKIALEIGFNGLEPAPKSDADRAEQGTQPPKRLTAIQEPEAAHTQRLQPKDVPIVSNGPLVTVISHHLFSAFMWAVSDYIQEDKLDKATVEDPELFDNSEFHSTWYLPTLRNKRLMKVARAIAGFGLGSVDDVLLGIIPPLSHRGILPNEAMMAVLLTKTKEHERYHDWDQTQEAYRHLMELPLHPKRLDRITYEVVVEIIEFLFLTTDTVTDLDVMVGPQKDIESEQGKSLREAVKAIMESLKAHDLLFKKAEELRWFYHKQRRKEKYERLYRSLKSIQRVRALNSPTNEDGQPKEPVQENNHASERSRSENKDIRKLDSSTQVVSEPDNELRKLTKFTSRHAKASRWRKDLKPSKQAAEPDEVGKQDIFGWYPLHYATVNRDDEVFEIILEGCSAKAQHELKDRSGRTPLHYAAMYEPGRIKRLIGNEQKGKSAANTRGRDGTLPIHCAARSAKMESVEQLSKYSNPAALDAFNRSPLHLGVMISNKEVVEHFCKDDNVAIIQTGAELLGRTALHLALVANSHRNNRDQKMREIIVALMTREKDLRAVTIVDEVCSSPITWALESNDEDFLGKILTRLSKVERRQSEDGQSNVSTECFKSILYDAVRLRSEFALRLAFRHIKDQKLEPAWIRDAFQTAQKLRRDDMLLLMLGIVDSLIPESSLVRDYTPPEVTTEFKTTTRSTDKHQPVISRSPPTNEDARPRVEVEIPSHTEPDDTAVNGRSIPFSSDFLNDLRKEFGNEIVTKLRQWIRSGNFSEIEKKLTYRDDSIATSIDWNQKDAGKRSGIAYLAKLRPKPDSNDALTGSDIRIRVLEALWKLWSQDERAKALNEPQGRYDKTPLIYAVRRDLRPLASFFLDKGAKVRDLDSRDMSAFTYALQKNDEAWKKMWKTMVESDPQVVNEPNRSYYRTTPLIEAVRYDHDKTLDFLSTCPELDPNIQDKEGDTALVWCYWQNEPMLKDLVDKFPKLDPHRRNLEGLSPLMVAYKDAFSDKLTPAIRDMFSARGKRMKEYEGTLMLSHAICRKKTELVKFLLGVGADPCSTDDTGRSQIELAAYHGDIELFKVLCEGRKILGHQLKRVYHACTQRADTTGDRILGELIEMKVAIELTDLDANGWTVRDCAACAGTLQSLMKWPQLQASLGRATDEKAGSQHIPPSSWAVRGDNPFIEADGCLLSTSDTSSGRL